VGRVSDCDIQFSGQGREGEGAGGGCYCFKDITDPMLRKILDDAVLRERFHVCPLVSVYVPFGLTGEFSGVC